MIGSKSFNVLFRSFSVSASKFSSFNGRATRKTLADISKLYTSKQPISMVTSHDFITSRMVDSADIDINLIGDSLANTTLGLEDTNELELEEFLYHVKSVRRGNESSLLIADLPFGTYELSPEQALETSIKLIKYGRIQGVKLEGGSEVILPTIKKLVDVGIPVMGHVGLTPQKHNALGGYKLQGTSIESAVQVYQECLNIEKAGAFAIVLECIPNKLAEYITDKLSIPTIGIGAGPGTSGQVLVVSDLLGMKNPDENHIAKFVKHYETFYPKGVQALSEYRDDVKSKQFPLADDHGYKIKRDVFEEFKKQANLIK
ncbi:ketopantoate hydroxymethyltransferase [Scheffersomyces amazonensis]|uniref:ketopantoate hydroxymethyltransferase n=1 Tax=Scheffersomyces amazonensis TaxID=1078765 RepID=UPI00315C7D7D